MKVVKRSAGKRPETGGQTKKPGKYVLHLYIAGLSPRSQSAIANIRKICESHLPGSYELVIKDIYQNPIFARDGQILAAPTLVKKLPLPLRRFVGDLSRTERVLAGLDLRKQKPGR